MALVAGTRLGPYEVQSLIGVEGMGEVYKARDTRLNRTVTLKVLTTELASHADRRARSEREARVIAAIDHPDVWTLSGSGSTKAQPISRNALAVGEQIGDALAAAHEAGIVHCGLGMCCSRTVA